MHDPEKYKPTQRFTGLANLYDRFRPNYPEQAISFIIRHCQLEPGKTLADIGAGTGISSRAMADKGLMVTAVEPNAEMINMAQSKEFSKYANSIHYVQAKAEDTGLSEQSFDAVFCAQAFHWFNPDLAFAEFNRILKHKGWLILSWNERDETDEKNPFTAAYGNLMRTLPNTALVEGPRGEAGEPLLSCPLFSESSKTSFENQQVLDLEGLIGRSFSSSYVPKLDTAEGQDFKKSLEALFAQQQNSGTVTLKYACSVYLGRKPD